MFTTPLLIRKMHIDVVSFISLTYNKPTVSFVKLFDSVAYTDTSVCTESGVVSNLRGFDQ